MDIFGTNLADAPSFPAPKPEPTPHLAFNKPRKGVFRKSNNAQKLERVTQSLTVKYFNFSGKVSNLDDQKLSILNRINLGMKILMEGFSMLKHLLK